MLHFNYILKSINSYNKYIIFKKMHSYKILVMYISLADIQGKGILFQYIYNSFRSFPIVVH